MSSLADGRLHVGAHRARGHSAQQPQPAPELALSPGQTKDELMRALEGHVLAEGQLTGTHGRK